MNSILWLFLASLVLVRYGFNDLRVIANLTWLFRNMNREDWNEGIFNGASFQFELWDFLDATIVLLLNLFWIRQRVSNFGLT